MSNKSKIKISRAAGDEGSAKDQDLTLLPLYEFRFGATFEPVDLFGRIFKGIGKLVSRAESVSE